MFLWILAAFCAFFVKGLCGFANTLVFDTILGFGVNNVNISPVELILGYPANITLVYKNRKQIRRPEKADIYFDNHSNCTCRSFCICGFIHKR